MRVLLRVRKIALQLFAQWLVDEVLDTVRRGVDMIGREPQMLHQI